MTGKTENLLTESEQTFTFGVSRQEIADAVDTMRRMNASDEKGEDLYRMAAKAGTSILLRLCGLPDKDRADIAFKPAGNLWYRYITSEVLTESMNVLQRKVFSPISVVLDRQEIALIKSLRKNSIFVGMLLNNSRTRRVEEIGESHILRTGASLVATIGWLLLAENARLDRPVEIGFGKFSHDGIPAVWGTQLSRGYLERTGLITTVIRTVSRF